MAETSVRNYTSELRAALAAGERVVCSMAPYAGNAVDYAPRTKSDHMPWVLAGYADQNGNQYRYTGRECHAVKP